MNSLAMTFLILMVVAMFFPILVWWIRNILRIIFKKEPYFISDNIKRIFIYSYAIAVIFFIIGIVGLVA